eukprot:3871561-Rhodomonas_salina.1
MSDIIMSDIIMSDIIMSDFIMSDFIMSGIMIACRAARRAFHSRSQEPAPPPRRPARAPRVTFPVSCHALAFDDYLRFPK